VHEIVWKSDGRYSDSSNDSVDSSEKELDEWCAVTYGIISDDSVDADRMLAPRFCVGECG
jgi:hypothetical protein